MSTHAVEVHLRVGRMVHQNESVAAARSKEYRFPMTRGDNCNVFKSRRAVIQCCSFSVSILVGFHGLFCPLSAAYLYWLRTTASAIALLSTVSTMTQQCSGLEHLTVAMAALHDLCGCLAIYSWFLLKVNSERRCCPQCNCCCAKQETKTIVKLYIWCLFLCELGLGDMTKSIFLRLLCQMHEVGKGSCWTTKYLPNLCIYT